MVDLITQYQAISKEIKIEFDSILESGAFINGPAVSQFEQILSEYLEVKHVIGCANGTDALQIALMALNFDPGDEIITTNFTFAATVEVIYLLGLKPILVDIDPNTFNIDLTKIKEHLTDKTKAIMPVHLFGRVCQMDKITDLAKEHDLVIIEDNAQSIGARYNHPRLGQKAAGTLGEFGTTSFFPAKNLGAYGDGGALFTNDDSLARQARTIANHGMSRRYYHDYIGVNSRLDTFQAAVLKIKLNHLDTYIQKRRESAIEYGNLLNDIPEIILPNFPKQDEEHVWHQYTIRILNGKRDQLGQHLKLSGIPYGIYYPIPLHKQKAYMSEEFSDEQFPITNTFSKQVLSLPMHSELTNQQIKFITDSIREFFLRK